MNVNAGLRQSPKPTTFSGYPDLSRLPVKLGEKLVMLDALDPVSIGRRAKRLRYAISCSQGKGKV